MAKLKITLKKSKIGKKKNHIKTVEALGLRKPGQTVLKEDNEAIRGMVNSVSYMVECEEVE
ncbi:MAG: 50S ribosomal protein L30 [Gallicola sp.]|nr:50S ribosomal protein L30 [Gallicola sp.]